ncbi:MAG TPA: hypothetical protein VIJ88_02760, partial [Candidatus Paceibacterota bacterium]
MIVKFPHLPASVLLSLASAALGCTMLIIFLCYSSGLFLKSAQPQTQAAATALATDTSAPLHLRDGALSAKAAILYDPTTGKILYDKNGQLTLPLASITKLMTAHAILNNVATSTLITLTNQDTLGGSDAGDWGLKVGDVLRLGDLIKIGLAASSNYAMAGAAG